MLRAEIAVWANNVLLPTTVTSQPDLCPASLLRASPRRCSWRWCVHELSSSLPCSMRRFSQHALHVISIKHRILRGVMFPLSRPLFDWLSQGVWTKKSVLRTWRCAFLLGFSMCSGKSPAVLSEVGSTAMMKLACVKTQSYLDMSPLIWTEGALDRELRTVWCNGNKQIHCLSRVKNNVFFNAQLFSRWTKVPQIQCQSCLFLSLFPSFSAQPSLLALLLLPWELASLSLLIPQRVVCVSVANQFNS